MSSVEMPVQSQLASEDGIATKVMSPTGHVPNPVSRPPVSSWPQVRGYEVTSVIGSGGMGIVYKARHRELRRSVALKMLRGAALADPEFHGRFQVEAEAVARLQHPNIIQVFEIGVVDPLAGERCASPFIALEFVDGGSLTRRTSKPQAPRYAAGMVEKLARAVHSAHRLGVVHRDLKPANVLLTKEGEPKIADFGLAKQLGTERDDGGRFLTQEGTVVGTPEYMAPEQAAGHTPAPAMDIYALGVILYELLTARVPFHAASPVETIILSQRREPVPPRQIQSGLPRDLETICLKCLEKLPSKRYATAEDLADDLRNYIDKRPIRARRSTGLERLARWCGRNPWVAASLAVVVGTFLTAFVLASRSYLRAEIALEKEAAQRQEAEQREKAERWERYRANITAAASSLEGFDAGGTQRNLQASPEEHRNWEWRHLNSRIDLAQSIVLPDAKSVSQRVIAADGSRVILFGEDEVTRVVDGSNGRVSPKRRPTPGINRAVISRDGKLLVYSVGNHSIELWDAELDRVRRIVHGHERNPNTVELSADNSRLLTAGRDQTIRVLDTKSGQSLCVFRPYKSNLGHVQFSPNGRRAIAANELTREVGLWDASTGGLISTLTGYETGYRGGHFNGGGTRFVSMAAFPCNELRLWDTESGKLLGVMAGHDNAVLRCAFSRDDTRIATGSLDQTIRLWDGQTGKCIATLTGHKGWVNGVAFSPDGHRLVSASQDHTLRLWDGRTGAALSVLPGHTADVESVAYTPDGTRIVSLSSDNAVRLWDTRLIERDGVLRGHTKFVYSVAYHSDGTRVASAGWDGTVRVWNTDTARQVSLFYHGDNAIVTSVAFHPAGKMIASRTLDAVYLWDLKSGREIHRWNERSDTWRHTRLAFSPKGDLLATGGADCQIHLWDVDSRAEIAVLHGHHDVVRDVAFSPDGQWLASAGEASDQTVRIWSVAEKRQVQKLKGHTGCVYALGFSADSKTLASGSNDGTVCMWNTSTWEKTALLPHGTNVYGVAFSPDGTRLACACANNLIRLWDIASQQEVVDLRGHISYAHQVAFSPDGTRLVSASGDFTVRIWDTIRPPERGH